jgi:electron transfer flavoprotein-quinone oxidoreductase
VLSDRVQRHYPQLACDLVEQLFTVDNPRRKKGGFAAARAALRHSDLRLRDIARDAWTGLRTFS